MPVILYPSDYAFWLDKSTSAEDLLSLFRPYDGPMTATAVRAYVNSPKNQGPQCVEPA